jgi:lysophospholipase L1-like esterase
VSTFAYAGDSTTADPNSWLGQWSDPSLTAIGGFAHGGYTSAQVLAAIDAGINPDTLVPMLGVNDIRLGISPTVTRTNLEAIAAKAGGSKVLLCAIVPNSLTNDGGINRQQLGEIWNRTQITIAWENGWFYCDPAVQFRQLDNGYAAGTCELDKVHPKTASYAQMSTRIAGYLHQLEGLVS